MKRDIFSHAIINFTDDHGYINFKIVPASQTKHPLTTFTSLRSATSFLNRVTEEYELCEKLNHISHSKSNCFKQQIGECKGACILEESYTDYNNRANLFIFNYSFSSKNLLIIDRGRSIEERSVILIKNGIFIGMGYADLNHQIVQTEVLESIITPMSHNRDTQHIIQAYLRKQRKTLKTKSITDETSVYLLSGLNYRIT